MIPGKVLYSYPGVSILTLAIGPSTFLEFVRYLKSPSDETYSNFWGIRGEIKENVVDPTPTNVWFPDNGLELKLAELEFLILEVSLIIPNLTFEIPDLKKYPSIALAYEALKKGGTSCASLNLSNDLTVDLFLKNKISFNEIYQLNNEVFKSHNWKKNPSVLDLYDLEVWINDFVKSLIK